MIETFELWIRDSLTQSLLLSPLMGAFFGLIFSSFTGVNREGGSVSVKETIIIIKERIVIRENNNQNPKTNDDSIGILFILVAAIVISVYFYAIYAELVIYYSSITAFNIITFGLSALVFSAAKGRLSSRDWVLYTLFPLVLFYFTKQKLEFFLE